MVEREFVSLLLSSEKANTVYGIIWRTREGDLICSCRVGTHLEGSVCD